MEITTRSDLAKLLDHHGLPRIVCEVGVAEGIFATEMFDWGLEKLYLVDIWENVPFIDGCASFDQEWHDGNYKQVQELFGDKENVVILKGFSYKMAKLIPDESLSLVYVDGDHTRSGCRADIETYWPKLRQGGIMAFHDYGAKEVYGVFDAVETFAQLKRLQLTLLPEDGDPSHLGAYLRKQVAG